MKNFVALALKYNYVVKVEKSDTGKGCIAHFPANIFKDVQPFSYIYDITEEGIELYNNALEQIASIEAPDFTRRTIVCYDILCRAMKLAINPELVLCYKGEQLLGNYTHFNNLVALEGDAKLETKFTAALRQINDDTYLVPEELTDIYSRLKLNLTISGEVIC